MVFSSMTFLCVFFPVVFALYYILPGLRARNVLLILASLLFYAYGEPAYVLLMIFSIVMNYFFGRMMNTRNAGLRKAALLIAVVINIGLLVVFKYTDMILRTINQLAGTQIPMTEIALPIGISFFTFQALSYVIDVYRDEVQSQKSVFNVMLYVSFFPQLIAGPIVKYHDIQKQIETRKTDVQEIAEGFRRFTIGLAKKVLISNTVAIAADGVFNSQIGEINIVAAWIGAISYMLQIYYDFSGYSDMAIGMGHMFGFHFQENFNYPYISASIKEFWRRWHISLSTWFKEYLYIPLGGNRKGKIRTCVNKMVVFSATGLWHGASWTFVLARCVFSDRRVSSNPEASWIFQTYLCDACCVYRICDVSGRHIQPGNSDDRDYVYRLEFPQYFYPGGCLLAESVLSGDTVCGDSRMYADPAKPSRIYGKNAGRKTNRCSI